jgi:hypothetical protein
VFGTVRKQACCVDFYEIDDVRLRDTATNTVRGVNGFGVQLAWTRVDPIPQKTGGRGLSRLNPLVVFS